MFAMPKQCPSRSNSLALTRIRTQPPTSACHATSILTIDMQPFQYFQSPCDKPQDYLGRTTNQLPSALLKEMALSAVNIDILMVHCPVFICVIRAFTLLSFQAGAGSMGLVSVLSLAQNRVRVRIVGSLP